MTDRITQSNTFAFPADGLDLALTAAPVAWGKGRWPSVDWIGDELIQVRQNQTGDALAIIRVRQPDGATIVISGFSDRDAAETWLRRTLGWGRVPPRIDEPVIASLMERFAGFRPYAHGALDQALLTVIMGQGVTVQAGAVLEGRVAALHSEGVEIEGRRFVPFPRIEQLAETPVEQLRSTGLTGRRAEGIVKVARLILEGAIPSDDEVASDPDGSIARLKALPMIGPWSAAAALLWGISSDDAHVTGDVALLRAAKGAYNRPDLTLATLDQLAESWRPGRAWAARALWLDLLGPAPQVAPDGTDSRDSSGLISEAFDYHQ